MRLAKQKAIDAKVISAILCGALLWAPSCSTPPLTEIIVSVNSTFAPDALDMVRLVIDRERDSRVVTVDLDEVESPFTQGVVHRGGSLNVSISVEGSFEGEVLLVQLVPIEHFVEGETIEVSVELSPSCVGVICSEGICMAGECVSPSVDAGPFDGGVTDGGLIDALADASLDVNDGPGTCPARRTDIEGDFVCAEGCDDCRLRCKTTDCRVTCRAGATCQAEADDVHIIAECEAGSTCFIENKNNKTGTLTVRCVESTCDVACNGDDPCDVLCENAECVLHCNDNADCSLRGCTPMDCGGNEFVCGRECP